MKTKHQLYLVFALIFMPFYLEAQNPVITGPGFDICPGFCYDIQIEGLNENLSYSVVWHIDYNGQTEFIETQGLTLNYCFWQPGAYYFGASVYGSNGISYFLEPLYIFVLDYYDEYVEIQATSSGYCPAFEQGGSNSGTNCQQVCAGSTVTYEAIGGFIDDFGYDWFVSGAESWYITQSGLGVIVVWGESGVGYVELYTFSSCSQNQHSLCVEIQPKPEASFNTTPLPSNGVITICEGETVFFENTSENASTYLWNFGDNFTTDIENPSHTYFASGTYEVTLVAFNDCLCADTTSLFVAVDEVETPILDCVSAVCAGEVVTYTSDAVCSTYQWTVSGEGTIIEGGTVNDNYITIAWSEGTQGLIELSIADCPSLDQCLGVASVQIPIISDAAQIGGPETICRGEISTYFLPQYEGTEFNWDVSNFGTILSGQGTNAISVEWFDGAFPPGPQIVSVSFNNCYLGCGGMDTLEVFARPEFFVEGPIESCENATTIHNSVNVQTNLSFNCNWAILAEDESVLWTSSGPTASPAVDWIYGTGNFTLVATPEVPSDYCVDAYEVHVLVVPNPSTLAVIEGDSLICPGLTYAYQTTPSLPNNRITWEINDGGAIYTKLGNPITVNWGNTPPYSIAATQTSSNGLPCTSEPLTMTVNPIANITIEGTTDVCQDQTSTYNITAFDQVDYEWTIMPADAGTIITSESSNEIEVLWHIGGAATVEVELCGVSASFGVNVLPRPEPAVVHPADLCPNEMAIVQTTTSYASYSWKDENGAVVSTDATPNLSPGYYQVIVTDQFGCLGDTTFHINAYPASQVSISTPDPNGFCNIAPFTRLYATNSDSGYDFQWLRNGIPVGSNNPVFTATQFGLYQVEILDENGCTALSNAINVVEDCSGGGNPNTGCGPLTTDFEILPSSDCNIHTYSNQTVGNNPGALLWNFDDPSSGSNSSTAENPSHEFSSAGFYRILLLAEFPNPADPANPLLCGSYKVDTIPLAADFEFDNACPGQAVEFSDLSTFLPITSISSWSWNFGDPGSGANNTSTDKNPGHIYTNGGTYSVNLSVISADGCLSKKSKTIEVYPPPTVSFEEPIVNCQRTASNFVADVPANVTNVSWDFGDPASGEANVSQLFNTYHAYDLPGTYTVSLEVTSIYGCKNSFSRTIVIEPNGLSGTISASISSPICEGDTTILSAPMGGITWEWSNGETSETIAVVSTEVYTVTVTDSDGCTYTPAPMPIDIIPTPEATIRAVEYDDYNQPSSYFYDSYEVCEGEDVFLEVDENTDYTFTWSTGENGAAVEYSEERGNLLIVGSHDIFLTVTDNVSGCQNEVGPFSITIHPLPTDVEIQASPAGTVCANTETTFSVINPNPSITYIWNTGEAGTSMTTSAGGEYYVRAINGFGCETESNQLIILDGPNINLVPTGCHSRCRPDTLCLPNIPGAVSYQWFFEDLPIAGPEGTIPELVVNESGLYYLEITDSDGCVQTSGALNLDLYDGFGTILGNVYVDVNENSLIDAGDTLINNIPIQLFENNTPIDTSVSNQEGAYAFSNILATAYILVLDTTALPANLITTTVQIDTQLIGCNSEVQIDWLLSPYCESISNVVDIYLCEGESIDFNGVSITGDTTFTMLHISALGCDSMEIVQAILSEVDSSLVTLQACTGSSVVFDGISLNPGEQQEFVYTNQNNCDSVITVMVTELFPSDSTLQLQACSGSTVDYEGESLSPGTQQDFTFINSLGCDSTVTVTVTALAESSSGVELFACLGSTAEYEGQGLSPGTVQDFIFTNSVGCDSTVTVTVSALGTSSSSVEFFACPGSTVDYEGESLSPGIQQDFIFTNSVGCDSMVTVTVLALETSNSALEFFACPGSTVDYEGESLSPGMQQDFIFTNSVGCDSMVTVTVSALGTSSSSVEFFACPGSTVDYEGESLSPGMQQDFIFINSVGCDSMVTVTVLALETSNSALEFFACPGSTVDYEGESLSPGMQQDFIFTNSVGCDSMVTVTVSALGTSSSSVEFFACPGSTVDYEGESLSPGMQQDFIFTNSVGCDSMVTVTVSALETSNSALEFFACPGSTVDYEGESLSPGMQQDFTFTNSIGCDSTVTVTVMALAESSSAVELFACAGGTVTYNNLELTPGDSEDFVFTNATGCDSTVSVTVLATPEIDYTWVSQESCPNEASGQLLIENLTGGTPPFTFSLDGINFQEDPVFRDQFSGNYILIVQDANGCVEEREVIIPSLEPLSIAVEDAILPCEEQSTTLEVQLLSGDVGTVFYQWEDGTAEPILEVQEPGIYAVSISDACMTIVEEVQVTLEDLGLSNNFYVPNAFSPNKDGINDLFECYSSSAVQVSDFNLYVFDRWGNQLFHSENTGSGWDGSYQGQVLGQGVYVWRLNATVNVCGRIIEVEEKGDVLLIR